MTQTTVGLACTATSPPSYCYTSIYINVTQTVPPITGNYAALVAANYSIQDDGTSLCTGAATETCYGDWYLPSKFELNLLYAQKTVVGGFANYVYWSSTENYSSLAWTQYFNDGSQGYAYKDFALPVRAVRAF